MGAFAVFRLDFLKDRAYNREKTKGSFFMLPKGFITMYENISGAFGMSAGLSLIFAVTGGKNGTINEHFLTLDAWIPNIVTMAGFADRF